MHAIRQHTFGGPEVLAYEEVPDLEPGAGQVRIAVEAAVDRLHRIPDHLDAAAAVAMIGTGRTAMGILDAAAIGADDVVLVTAAAGGLGSLLVQAAHAAGAVVAGVAGGEAKVALVRSLGADVVADYLDPGWPAAVRAPLGDRPVTVLLDGVGGAIGRAAVDLVGPGGGWCCSAGRRATRSSSPTTSWPPAP